MLRASVAAELAGVPSVSLICEGFVGQARATGEGLGFAGIPSAVLAGHVDSQSTAEMLSGFIEVTVDQVVAGLTLNVVRPSADLGSARTPAAAVESAAESASDGVLEPEAREIVVSGSYAQVNDAFVERGWSDGLPIVPPTIAAVEAFLRHVVRPSDDSLGIVKPSGRTMTVWSVAVNGVMAGCRPEQMPVLIALAEVIADPNYGVEHSGNTTGADALIVINGPSKSAFGFNHGQGALRDGYQANTAVGRFWRLMLRNICGFLPGEHDKATFGNSFKVVLSEDEVALADIGWRPFSHRFGFDQDDDVVTVARYNSGAIIGSVKGSTAEEVLPYLADGLVRVTGWDLAHVYGLGYGQYRPLLVLSPMIARTIAGAGWSQDDLRQALFEQARIPAHKFEKFIIGWTNFVPGNRTLVDLVNFRKLPKIFAESADPDRLVPIVLDPSCIDIAVAGDPFRANAFVFSSDGPHGFPTAKQFFVKA